MNYNSVDQVMADSPNPKMRTVEFADEDVIQFGGIHNIGTTTVNRTELTNRYDSPIRMQNMKQDHEENLLVVPKSALNSKFKSNLKKTIDSQTKSIDVKPNKLNSSSLSPARHYRDNSEDLH
eukprot:CAMPEP_0116870416 /NCGR_PEP_ID=MMETSP0463-20121206/305_1 /TAXON_ID=181622 /ORGANISM="Strombidinopsis sp, Strain SopsisLIS2011" /LENGTH=121 /DNA_ID=CAMNT_0004506893 /DNA_START=358 /DNA_END=723 /DNA_ORIENTATION=+